MDNPYATVSFCDIADQKKKAGFLNLSYNLLNQNLNSKHHFDSWGHSYQENIVLWHLWHCNYESIFMFILYIFV